MTSSLFRLARLNDTSMKSSVPLIQYKNNGDALPSVMTTMEIPNYCTSQCCNPNHHSQEATPSDSPVTKPNEQHTGTNGEEALNVSHSSSDMSLFTLFHTEITKDDSS